MNVFKRISLAIPLSFILANAVLAAEYKVDPAHSQIMFRIKHLGISSVTGRFDKFEGTFSFEPSNIAASKAQATIDVNSINTNQEKRDKHLRTPDFFDVVRFPKMTYTSKAVKDLGNKKFQITGDLEMHGIKKEVTVDAEYVGSAKGPSGDERAAFLATAKLNRKDFGLKWNDITETGGVLVGDDVTITIEVEGVKEGSQPVPKM